MAKYKRAMREAVTSIMMQVDRKETIHAGKLIEELVTVIKRESKLTIARRRGIEYKQQRREEGGGEEEMFLREINEMWERTRGGKDLRDGEEAEFRRNAMKTLRMRDTENWRNFLKG